ncbi:MAG: OmpA family protein [Gammaproteobacteria bacterium]|nr:OmpA family protein [Gammaproteobacteria bacterium]NNM21318.1 OmpA family protein [Gammaproteobacteria bacterium]
MTVLVMFIAAVQPAAFGSCAPDCPDGDRDGVVDTADQCPESEHGAPVTMTGCAHDTDADGIPDYRDRCPHLSAASVDAWGCPAGLEIFLEGLSFETNSARFAGTTHPVLEQAVRMLVDTQYRQVLVAGHTDDVGSAEHNRRLSRQRAEAVRQYLVAAGLDSGRIVARGYGESRPIADNTTEQGRSRNRRVVLHVLGIEPG